MHDPTDATAPAPRGLARWWIYQRERFPVLPNGLLIAAFSACAVSFSSVLAGDPTPPSWPAYLVAFLTCFLFFLQLRIADEFKDHKEDATYRPYRPVPRGLVTLKELALLFAGSAAVQLGLALWLHPPLVLVLSMAWIYLSLMSVEFFARDWLKARPITYLWTHMLIMPIVDLYATACHWMPADNGPPHGLLPFLAASFTNGIVIETGRKLRLPADEEHGVETYSKLWGIPNAAWVWWSMLALTFLIALAAARPIGMSAWLAVGLAPILLFAATLPERLAEGSARGTLFEKISAIWTLLLYLLLGLVPRFLH